MTTFTQPLRQKTIEYLQDLVRINIDAAAGFETAADQIEVTPLANMFKEEATRRRAMAGELRHHIQLSDEDAELTGSLKGRLHRWWLSIRQTLGPNEAYAILAEAERGEDAIRACYEEAISETAGSPVGDILACHLQSIVAMHARIRTLRDAYKGD